MKKILQQIYLFFKINNFYRKMFLLYASFTLIVVIFTSTFLMNYLGGNLENDIYASNKNLLEQIRSFSDKFLVSEINVPLSEFIVNTFSRSSTNSAITAFLYNTKSYNASEMVKTFRELTKIQMRHDFITSIYLYRVFDDTLISSKEGLVLEASNRNELENRYFNSSLIKKASSMKGSRQWISPLENIDYWYDTPVISVIQSIPFSPVDQSQQGYVIINIDINTFIKSIFLNKTGLNTAYFFAVDHDGRVFLHSDPEKLLTPFFGEELKDIILEKEQGFRSINISGNNFAYQWIKSSINDWTYVSFIPMQSLNKQIFKSRQISLLFIGLVTIMSIIGTHLITRGFTRFVSRLTLDIRKSLNIKNNNTYNHDPFFTIVRDLENRAKEFEEERKKNKILSSYKLGTDLLYGNISDKKSLKERLTLIDKDFALKKYCLVLIETDVTLFEKLSFEQREFIRYLIIKTSELFFDIYCHSLCISLPNSHIAAILNLDDTRTIKSHLGSLLNNLKEEVKFNHNIAISHSISNPAKFYKLYDQTQKFLGYSYFLNYGNVFTPDLIHKFEKNSLTFHISALKEYEILLNSRKYDVFKDKFLTLYDSMKKGHYSLAIAKNISIQFINLISRLAREQGIEQNEMSKNVLFSTLEKIKFISSYKKWIISLIDIYQESISTRDMYIENDFIEKISLFIETNADNDISQRSVAEEFGISQSHLSRIFKEGMGISFSDFVINTKFKRASELLIENSNETITEVAKKLGYLDLPYFSRLFKQRYGMTPSKYRKNHTYPK